MISTLKAELTTGLSGTIHALVCLAVAVRYIQVLTAVFFQHICVFVHMSLTHTFTFKWKYCLKDMCTSFHLIYNRFSTYSSVVIFMSTFLRNN